MKNIICLFVLFCGSVSAQVPMASYAGMNTDTSWFELIKPEFNSDKSDFGITRLGAGYVFASTRTSSYTIRYQSTDEESPLLDLYFIKDSGSGFSEPVAFSSGINTMANNEGPLTSSRDGQTLIYTSNDPETRKLVLMESRREKNNWSAPAVLHFCSDGFTYVHPNLACNDSILFFSSDRVGGYGGMDIYFSRKTDGGWSRPANAGKTINSSHDENYPFCSAEGVLYFSSNRNSSDLDLFVIGIADTNTSQAMRLASPFNSAADDFGFYISGDGREGFFSSNRGNGKQDDDIYQFRYSWPKATQTDTIVPVEMCYGFFEEATARTGDTVLMKYIWYFSDGDVLYGHDVLKCFDTTGVFVIRLSVRDSSGGDVLISETEYDFVIVQPNYASIQSPDTVDVMKSFEFNTSLCEVKGFDILQVCYDFGNGYNGSGRTITHQYPHSGIYYPKVYLLMRNKETGATESRCVVKKLVVI